MVRATILEKEIDYIFWPEIVLAMTHIKKLKAYTSIKKADKHYWDTESSYFRPTPSLHSWL